MKTTYTQVPKEVKEALAPLLTRYGALVAHKVDHFEVEFTPNSAMDGDVVYAATLVMPEYRRATLYVTPEWLRLPCDEREHVVAHEVAHTLTFALRSEYSRVLEHFVGDPSTRAYVTGVFEAADEEVVDSLAKVFVDLMREGR